jgi:hypothetical protein
MAPAAGAGIGKYIADEVMKRGMAVKMVDAVERALECQRSFRSGQDIITEPDCKTQLAAVIWLTAHMVGEPVKRHLHEHLIGAEIDVQTALRESPGTMRAMERAIEKAKFRDRKKKPGPGPAILVAEDVPE